MKTPDVPIGAKISKALKKKLDRFCEEHGLKMNHVVETALQDKLGELEEELSDRTLTKERLKDRKYNLYRIRQGDWRIIYTEDYRMKEVRIMGVRHRKETYR